MAAATLIGSGAFAATFNYTADGGVVKGSVVDHDLSGPEYNPTLLFGPRGTLMYHSQNFLYDWFTSYNGHNSDTKNVFTYDLADGTWMFPTPPNSATEASGLSWGVNYTNAAQFGPFYLDTSPRPAEDACAPVMGSSASPAGCLNDGTMWYGQSGAGFRPVTTGEAATVDSNGTMEVFGWLVHFNRDILPKYMDPTHALDPKGLDMNISWTLHLNDANVGGSWTDDVNLKFVLHFWETSNQAVYPEGLAEGNGTCPRSIAGIQTVHFSDGSTVDFLADGAPDLAKPAGAGCDDAWTFAAAPDTNETPSFMYNGHQYDIHISGFYKWEYDEGTQQYICDGSGVPFNTLWADESNETIGCIKFNITEVPELDQGCTPGYWKQPQHYDDWTTYAKTDSYNTIFGVDATPYCGDVDERNAVRKLGLAVRECPSNMSLGEAIWMRGNADGLGQVIYQSTAALLNAANPDINYPLTIAEIIAKVQAAFADPSIANSVSSELDGYNNLHNNDVCGYDNIEPMSI